MPVATAEIKKAQYGNKECVRCGTMIDKGSPIEQLPVGSGKNTWHRWVHVGCGWKAPFNSLDEHGNPTTNNKLVSGTDTSSGITNSADPEIKNAGKGKAGGESTPVKAMPLEQAAQKANLEQNFQNACATLSKPKPKTGDDYFDEPAEGEQNGNGKVPAKSAKGGKKPSNGKAGQGDVQIPKHSPELEDWVRLVCRDELGNVLPGVLADGLAPLVLSINNKLATFEDNQCHQNANIQKMGTELKKQLDEGIARLKAIAESNQTIVHEYKITKPDGKLVKFDKKEVLHEVFPRVLDLATTEPRQHIFLSGPSGSGKGYLADQLAKALDLPYGYMSCSGGLNEAHLLGRTIPNTVTGEACFITSEYVKRYEEGGVFLLDEIDAADSNVLIVVNASLASDVLAVPNRLKNPYAKKHKDFVCVVAANTFGRGSTRMYVGRNQLDEATLDRFRIGMIHMDYSPAIEALLCPEKSLRDKLLGWRAKMNAAGLRRVLSTRFLAQAHCLATQKGWTIEAIFNALTSGWSEDEKAKVK